MKLSPNAVASRMTIYSPRWHDRVVLIATFRVGEHNIIEMPRASKNWVGEWYVSGEDVRQSPKEKLKTKQGRLMDMYAVPLDKLVVYEGRNE